MTIMRSDHDPDDAFLEHLAARLRTPVPLSNRVEGEVLRRITAASVSRSEYRAWARKSPAALGLAAGIALVFGLGVLVGRRSAMQNVSSGDTHPIEFVLRTSADSAVALVGDFNNWDPRSTPLRATADSLWSVVVPLRPGRYRYTFVVDGNRWSRDPSAPRALEDDFGTPTSVITVAQR
jgi:Glycogen recognition site of AMP-activated protein kinase